MKKLLLAAALLGGIGSPAFAMSCTDDSVSEVSSDGSILKTLSGYVYEISTDAFEVELWLPTEDLLVCDGSGASATIINTENTSDGKITASRLK
jgi:hypothetical protein